VLVLAGVVVRLAWWPKGVEEADSRATNRSRSTSGEGDGRAAVEKGCRGQQQRLDTGALIVVAVMVVLGLSVCVCVCVCVVRV
jgi:cytochrome b